MRALLIDLKGAVYPVDISEQLRGGFFQLADKQPVSAKMNDWTAPLPIRHRTFQWRGQMVRKNGSELFDFFEEVER